MKAPLVPFAKSIWGTIVKFVRGFTKTHDGIDYSMPIGTPLLAAQDGYISSVGKDVFGGYWLHIKGDDGRGYLYVHISKDILNTDYKALALGAKKYPRYRVKRGQVVCYSGNTGKSTGPHLHYEIRDSKGRSINPVGVQVFDEPKKPTPTPPPPIQVDPDKARIEELEKELAKIKLDKQMAEIELQGAQASFNKQVDVNTNLEEINKQLKRQNNELIINQHTMSTKKTTSEYMQDVAKYRGVSDPIAIAVGTLILYAHSQVTSEQLPAEVIGAVFLLISVGANFLSVYAKKKLK